eukprot:g6383.t1
MRELDQSKFKQQWRSQFDLQQEVLDALHLRVTELETMRSSEVTMKEKQGVTATKMNNDMNFDYVEFKRHINERLDQLRRDITSSEKRYRGLSTKQKHVEVQANDLRVSLTETSEAIASNRSRISTLESNHVTMSAVPALERRFAHMQESNRFQIQRNQEQDKRYQQFVESVRQDIDDCKEKLATKVDSSDIWRRVDLARVCGGEANRKDYKSGEENRIDRKNGEVLWVDCATSSIVKNSGKQNIQVSAMQRHIKDIRERIKNIENRLSSENFSGGCNRKRLNNSKLLEIESQLYELKAKFQSQGEKLLEKASKAHVDNHVSKKMNERDKELEEFSHQHKRVRKVVDNTVTRISELHSVAKGHSTTLSMLGAEIERIGILADANSNTIENIDSRVNEISRLEKLDYKARMKDVEILQQVGNSDLGAAAAEIVKSSDITANRARSEAAEARKTANAVQTDTVKHGQWLRRLEESQEHIERVSKIQSSKLHDLDDTIQKVQESGTRWHKQLQSLVREAMDKATEALTLQKETVSFDQSSIERTFKSMKTRCEDIEDAVSTMHAREKNITDRLCKVESKIVAEQAFASFDQSNPRFQDVFDVEAEKAMRIWEERKEKILAGP